MIVSPLLLSGTMAMAQPQTQASNAAPTFDCTAEETATYIRQVSHGLYSPSPVPTPQEFKKAFIEQQQAAAAAGQDGAQACVSIFGDGSLSDDWKKAIDAIRDLDINVDFSGINGALLKKILEEARDRIVKQVGDALGVLGEDICKMLSSDNLKDIARRGLNEKYGINARNMRMKDFAEEATDEAMDEAPDNIRLLTDSDELPERVDDATREKLRRARNDMWDGF